MGESKGWIFFGVLILISIFGFNSCSNNSASDDYPDVDYCTTMDYKTGAC